MQLGTPSRHTFEPLCFIAVSLLFCSCGVKGPPLPPLLVTPQKAEQTTAGDQKERPPSPTSSPGLKPQESLSQ